MPKTQVTVESRPTQQPVQPQPKQPPRRLEEKKLIFRTYQIIWYLLGIIETLLLFRFTFKLFGASQVSPFVRALYAVSDGLTYPFRGIFPVGVVDRSIFEWASLVAMAVYAVFAYGIVYTLQLVKPVDPEDIEEAVDNP